MSDINIATVKKDKNLKAVFYNDKCDKYDYLAAVGCGAIAGLVDIFLVGSPVDSKLQGWTDTQVNQAVMKFAKLCGWSPRAGKEDNLASAIGFLERTFPVNYDHAKTTDVDGLFKMSCSNHHMKSLAHSPSPIGLFFSILNQFTSTSSFLHNGQLITIKTDTFELEGHNLISKLFCGIANWFGHIMSDIAGSSGSVNRGSGVVIPFYELFQLCDFGSFQVDKHRNNLATVATKVFEKGYDARFGLTMSIPVVLCDLSIKLIWAIRHYFVYKKPLNECIPTKFHDDLRMMLLVGDGTLCIMDVADAALRANGNWVNFFMRLNVVAWFRFISLVFREVCIRAGINYALQKQLDAYIRINAALAMYLDELEKIDYDLYVKEMERYNRMIISMEHINSEEELNVYLKNEYKNLGLKLPYTGDFDDFMSNKSNVLRFE